MAGGKAGGTGEEVLIEFVIHGNVARVTAIHVASGTEVAIVGPANAPRVTLEAAVSRKLAYVMGKEKGTS
jgi:NADPH-dependent ferric siderophore reductase